MRIWPAIDIRAGKCVRLRQGDYQQETVFGDDPTEMARRFVDQGATGLHVVDLDGARDGQSKNFAAIQNLAKQIEVPIQVGGGIRSTDTIEQYVDAGIERVIVGTRAVNEPDWIEEVAGKFPNRMVVGIDARDGRVATDGWLNTSDIMAVDFAIQISKHPIAGIIGTDIARDGMLSGPNFDTIAELNDAVDCPVIASGGVTSVEDVAHLASLGIAGCIIGRALYDGHLTMSAALAAVETGMSRINK